MAGESLQDQLRAVAGVSDARVDDADGTPRGVKVTLAPGADPDEVGEQVRALLASHGIRSQVGGETAASPPPPPGAPGAVVALPGVEPELIMPAAELAPAPESVPSPSGAVSGSALGSLAVAEGRSGVTVTATARDGRTAVRRARSADSGINEAVIAAVADLLVPGQTPPLVVAIEDVVIAETPLVIVVLESGDGRRHAGAAVLEGGRAYGIAVAAWVALSDAS